MIVVSGEALMDVWVEASTASGMRLDARMGGSPFNVAIGLARLGVETAFFGGLSRGVLGERLAAALAGEGIDLGAAVRSSAPTTLALVGLDAQGVPDYAFYGEGAADRRVEPAALAAVPAAAALHFGSYSMVVDPVATTLRRLAEREHGRAVISWDPNVRPTVEPDLDRWRALFAAMVPLVHLLKVSEEDLAPLFPGADPADLAAIWLARGVRLVVVTRGSDGASAFFSGGRIDVPALPVELVDTVGAGDAFQAALLADLEARGRLTRDGIATAPRADLEAILHFASAAAAIVCSRRGADLPRRVEVEARLTT